MKEFKDKADRLFWLVAVVLTFGFAGIFYFIRRGKMIKSKQHETMV